MSAVPPGSSNDSMPTALSSGKPGRATSREEQPTVPPHDAAKAEEEADRKKAALEASLKKAKEEAEAKAKKEAAAHK